jgi:hypothetical protein
LYSEAFVNRKAQIESLIIPATLFGSVDEATQQANGYYFSYSGSIAPEKVETNYSLF